MTDEDWADGELRTLSFLVRGEAGEYHLTATGEPQPDDSFLLILNASHEPIDWVIPALEVGTVWERLFDTDTDDGFNGGRFLEDKKVYTVQPRSFVLMVRRDNRG
jgi:glycogen operon protein